jgi:hypothetical protein
MKKTLLAVAAALAASAISSQAQVYSQNIVGYENLATPTAGKSYPLTVQFTIGASNGVNEVFGTSLPDGTKLLIWNGVNNYNIALYDSSDPNGVGAGAPLWYQNDDQTPLSPLPTLVPGQGFFIVPSAPLTNTFAGVVAVNPGSSNVLSLATAGRSYFVGSVIPYGGAISNGTASGGGINLNGLHDGTKLLIWNGVNNYNIALYDSSDPNGVGAGAPLWYQNDDQTPYVDPATSGNTPSLNVGQGFFIVPSAPTTWTNGLSAQ